MNRDLLRSPSTPVHLDQGCATTEARTGIGAGWHGWRSPFAVGSQLAQLAHPHTARDGAVGLI